MNGEAEPSQTGRQSYADELLAGLSDEEEEVETDHEAERVDTETGTGEVIQEDKSITAERDQHSLEPATVDRIGDVCKLAHSKRLRDALAEMDHYSADQATRTTMDRFEQSPEYDLVLCANGLVAELDQEVTMAHVFIRHHYQPRFPELESLVANPRDLVQAILAIGNHDNPAKAKLDGILPHGVVVVISMQAALTKGRRLEPTEWQRIEEACHLTIELERIREQILQYVESRMGMVAPNLSKVVGSQVATKLLGIAGGLTAMIKIPSCNLMLLGDKRNAALGLSTNSSGRHQGVLVQAPLIYSLPEEYHRQALRMVSAKALLAARVDAAGTDRHGTYGAQLQQELVKKLDKLQEPPPAKMVKALPIPKEGGGNKTRRGGRKARKFKERNGMSELRKMQNRVRFGEAEEEAGAFDETMGMGMIGGKGDTGAVRAQLANQATKARMSKRNTERIQAIQRSANATQRLEAYLGNEGSGSSHQAMPSYDTSDGLTTVLSMTPADAVGLSEPAARQQKVAEANAKWFKEGTFSVFEGGVKRRKVEDQKEEP